MKNLKTLASLFLVFATITFISCENEPIDPNINLDDFDQNCEAPSSFQASDFINGNSVSLSWVAADEEVSWTIEYGPQGFTHGNGTTVNATQTTHVITGLNSANNYSFYLKSNCSDDSSSAWVGPINVLGVVNTNCASPSALTAVRGTSPNTTVNVAWTAGGTETSWEIQYGAQGFALGSGTTVTSTTLTKQISGISNSSAHDFYVRAKCSGSEFSSWVGPVNVASVVVTTPPTYMNATINGQTFTGMKPFLYTFTGLKAKLYSSDPSKVLWIQGDSNPLDPSGSNNFEINLKINEAFWAPGTYTLYGDNNGPEVAAEVDLIIITPTNPAIVYENEINGTITITEFNVATKRIRGTFSFTYMLSDNGVETGPFSVTNGSFDFEMQDEVFN